MTGPRRPDGQAEVMRADQWSTVTLREQRRALGRPALPRMGMGAGGVEAVNFLEAYAELINVTYARVVFLGELLAEQLDQDGGDEDDEDVRAYFPGPPAARGLIGYTMAATVTVPVADQQVRLTPTGEARRALVDLERDERKELARLIEKSVSMGVQLHQVEAMRSYGTTISTSLAEFARELGLTLDDAVTLRAAQRAVLAARRSLGQDDGDPDVHVGPGLSAEEKVTALRSALARAEAAVTTPAVE